MLAHKRYAGKGRPGAHRAVKAIEWQISATFTADDERLEALRHQKACFVIATNVPAGELSDAEVFQASHSPVK